MTKRDSYIAAALEAADVLDRLGEPRHAASIRAMCLRHQRKASGLTSMAMENARLRFIATRPENTRGGR